MVIAGTPSLSPFALALVQTSAQWDIPLARLLVDAGESTIAAGNVTDERAWATQGEPLFEVPIIVGNGVEVITTGIKGLQMQVPAVGKSARWWRDA